MIKFHLLSGDGICLPFPWIWADLTIWFDIKCGKSETTSILSLSFKRFGNFHVCFPGTQPPYHEEVQAILLESKRPCGEPCRRETTCREWLCGEHMHCSQTHWNITTWVILTDNMWSNDYLKLLSLGCLIMQQQITGSIL